MNKFIAVPVLTALACLGCAQISESEASSIGMRYLTLLAPDATDKQARVILDDDRLSSQSVRQILVVFGEIYVWLSASGEFTSFANLSAEALEPQGGAPERFRLDEQAWEALEELLPYLDPPIGLERKKLVRLDREGEPFACRFTMETLPYGYETDGGNVVWADLHRITGRVLELHVGRGWSYEPPNVRASAQEAVAKAVSALGGEPAEWRTVLKYSSTDIARAPEYLRPLIASKTMRLMYVAYSNRGTVRVDTVTGAVVDYGRPASAGASNSASTGATAEGTVGATSGGATSTQRRPLDSDGSNPSSPTSGSSPPLAVWIGGLVALAGGTALLWRLRGPKA